MKIETIPAHHRLKFTFTIKESDAFQFYLTEGRQLGTLIPGLPGQGCAFLDLHPRSDLEPTADWLRWLWSQRNGSANEPR